jgi:hypothetical protein
MFNIFIVINDIRYFSRNGWVKSGINRQFYFFVEIISGLLLTLAFWLNYKQTGQFP